MTPIHKVAPDLFQVTLSAPSALGPTWSAARNVYVFTGDAPALIDSGYAHNTDELHAALRTLELAPTDIRRIVLTSYTADAVGGAHTFPNARLWSALAPETAPLHAARQRYEQVFGALKQLPNTPPEWSHANTASLDDTVFATPPANIQYLESGQPIRLGSWILDALPTHGLAYPAAAYFAADKGWLFSGPAVNMRPRAILEDPTSMVETLNSLGAMSIKKVLPIRGDIEEHPDIFFRALSLYVTNMRANMKYIFEDPQSSIDLVHADFGYWPEDLFETAERLMMYDAVFREFDEAGVVHVVEDGPVEGFPRYNMGAPGAGRGDATN